MTKVKARAGSEHFPFTKPVLVGGLGFTFSVVLLLFHFLCRSLFLAEIVQSPCVPAGGAGTGFCVREGVRELWQLEGLGREHLLVPLGSPGVPRMLLVGSSISPRSLFPQSHAWIRSVALGGTIVSLSPAPRPPSSASLRNLWEHGRVSPHRTGCRDPRPCRAPTLSLPSLAHRPLRNAVS